MMSGTLLLINGVVAGLLVFAAARDIATRVVPNWVSMAILACGCVLQASVGSLIVASGLGLLVFVAAAFMWHRGWLGGADVKLLGAAAVAVAPVSVTGLLLAVSLAGGVLALFYLSLSRLVRRPLPGPRKSLLPRVMKAELWRIRRRAPLPYAVAIAVGGLLTLFSS